MNTAAKGALLLVFALVATVTLSTNAYSVGQSCDSGCGSNEYCDYGSYTCQCNSGYTDCSGTCVDTNTDHDNCGSCYINCGGNSCCNGVCTNTGSDNYNCGSCGNNCCPLYDPWCWWSAHCTSGICCAMSQTNCGGSCVDTGNDPANCGSCGNNCGSNAYCSGGSCYCNMGYTNCGSGCTNTNTDSNNCGGCGTVCGTNQYCSGGICTNNPYCGDGNCDTGWGENSANCCQDCGNSCGDGTCTTACGESCNSCSMDCGMCPYCGNGICEPGEDCVCQDCACQGCGMTCDTTQSPPVCRFSACDGKQCGDNGCGGTCGYCGVGQTCDGNGQCQNCQNCNGGAMNCGYDNCGQYCGDPGCMGYCGSTCDSNVCTFHGCDGRVCGTDPSGCGVTCGSGSCTGSNTHCNAYGQCECDNGFIDCNGDGNCEVNPNTDTGNCGGCNQVCSSNHIIPSCSSGLCTGDCDAGWGDANGDKNTPNGDGCETDLNTEQNCGSIGNVCTQHTLCSNGACTLCELGYGDCNLDAGQLGGNGCETTLTNNNDNCGTCGNKCDTTHFCQGASCVERPVPGGALPGFEPSLIAMLLAAIAAPVLLMRKY